MSWSLVVTSEACPRADRRVLQAGLMAGPSSSTAISHRPRRLASPKVGPSAVNNLRKAWTLTATRRCTLRQASSVEILTISMRKAGTRQSLLMDCSCLLPQSSVHS